MRVMIVIWCVVSLLLFWCAHTPPLSTPQTNTTQQQTVFIISIINAPADGLEVGVGADAQEDAVEARGQRAGDDLEVFAKHLFRHGAKVALEERGAVADVGLAQHRAQAAEDVAWGFFVGVCVFWGASWC